MWIQPRRLQIRIVQSIQSGSIVCHTPILFTEQQEAAAGRCGGILNVQGVLPPGHHLAHVRRATLSHSARLAEEERSAPGLPGVAVTNPSLDVRIPLSIFKKRLCCLLYLKVHTRAAGCPA